MNNILKMRGAGDMLDMKILFRSGEAARRIGVSKIALIDWERRGILIPERKTIGGHRLYSKEQIETFIKERMK